MFKRFFYIILLSFQVILSACNSDSHVESIVKPIKGMFGESGIQLQEKEEKSNTFTFSGSDEEHYTFNDGNIYLLYNFSNRDRVAEQLTTVFAEEEFPYGVSRLKTEQFIIIFIADSESNDTKEKIESVFQELKSRQW
ncbi:hypothetical protein NC661_11760 [Aquibacillus koreensis]|uniref:Uncharacterized protein n=1 Tax=Aquibacillus koreensis TaxID=279446 RepID=A0A9X4AIS9_9BACI|nr:hypothetical protein [Aquibacillus koreensis]MCT2535185.1 hypothetical protein [Aquibacillus koreensis]MDC3421044.1 hypothetical protein [Aquibacillus koreensis]